MTKELHDSRACFRESNPEDLDSIESQDRQSPRFVLVDKPNKMHPKCSRGIINFFQKPGKIPKAGRKDKSDAGDEMTVLKRSSKDFDRPG